MTEATFLGETEVHLTVVSTLPVASCPECGHVSQKVHDESAAQLLRDLALVERRCWLVYHAGRFKCEPCRETFVERVDWKRPQVSYTEWYERALYQRLRRESVQQVAEDEGLSEETVQALFETWAKKRSRHAATPK